MSDSRNGWVSPPRQPLSRELLQRAEPMGRGLFARACKPRGVRRTNYFFFPSGPNCWRKASRLSISVSFGRPAKIIFVPGTFAFGFLIYSRKFASSQVMPEFLFASE